MKPTLLIVDDEKNILNSLERMFEEDNYLILTATSGKDGLKLLEQHPVQVIISDYRMPNMTGVEFFTQIKKLYPETIRIILSAYADFNAVRDAINEGAIYKFLNKPWDENQLRKQVHEAFLMNAKQKEKEQTLIRLMNYARLTGLNINKSASSLVSEVELQQALEKELFVIHYQPIVEASSGKIKGVEALLRLQHPAHGLVFPDQFIPLCEETGLIVPIGTWVLYSACQQLKRWHKLGFTELFLAVNISVFQFDHSGFLDSVRDTLIATKIPPHCLELEITESLVMSNMETNITLLQMLRNLGAKISLDDFGTGYSSLSYLNLFPINVLKIDKSFIQNIASKKDSLEIVTAIIALAKSLGLSIIAEGVETKEQLEILKEKNCDLIQGYLFSKPVQEQALTQLLKLDIKS